MVSSWFAGPPRRLPMKWSLSSELLRLATVSVNRSGFWRPSTLDARPRDLKDETRSQRVCRIAMAIVQPGRSRDEILKLRSVFLGLAICASMIVGFTVYFETHPRTSSPAFWSTGQQSNVAQLTKASNDCSEAMRKSSAPLRIKIPRTLHAEIRGRSSAVVVRDQIDTDLFGYCISIGRDQIHGVHRLSTCSGCAFNVVSGGLLGGPKPMRLILGRGNDVIRSPVVRLSDGTSTAAVWSSGELVFAWWPSSVRASTVSGLVGSRRFSVEVPNDAGLAPRRRW
jgi:hypothetical protein